MKGLALITVAAFLVLQVCHTDGQNEGEVNGACTDGTSCTNADRDTCETQTDDSKKCKTKEGQNCVSQGDCIENAECDGAGKPCQCNNDYTPNTDNTVCLEVVKIDEECTAGEQKCPENTEEDCPASPGVCTCGDNFVASPDKTSCVEVVKIGETCTADEQKCPENTKEDCPASPGVCECDESHVPTLDKTSCTKGVGDACLESECGPNATCSSEGTCACDDGFEESAKQCKAKSGAPTMVASFLLIVSVLVTSHIL